MTTHRRGIAIAWVAGLLAFAGTTPAADAGLKVRGCGHYGYLESIGDVGWTHDLDELSGAGIYRVVSRGVPCEIARRVAQRASPGNSYRGWRCRYLRQAWEYAKIRCGRPSGRMVRWETGA